MALYKKGEQQRMYQVADLFDRRSTFAIKLEKYLEAKSITKTQLCKEAGISRPTLDKILSAEITNRTNFIKHVTKIFIKIFFLNNFFNF